MKDKLKSPGTALSGGQQQRLCIARAIAVEPDVILMDEPCSALDPIATLKIEELMRELRENYTIVIVTHNMQQAARASDTTVFLTMGDDRAGYMVENGADRAAVHATRERADRAVHHRAVRMSEYDDPTTTEQPSTNGPSDDEETRLTEPVMGANGEQTSDEEVASPRATLDSDLRAVKDDVLRLGALVEVPLERAGRAVVERDVELADRVRWDDAEVNDLQRRVSNEIAVTLATQQPMARDLRELLALYHAAAELERMGDYAVNIAKLAQAAGLGAGDPDVRADPADGTAVPLAAAGRHAGPR